MARPRKDPSCTNSKERKPMTPMEFDTLKEIINEASRTAGSEHKEAMSEIYRLWNEAKERWEDEDFDQVATKIQEIARWRWPGVADRDLIKSSTTAQVFVPCNGQMVMMRFATLPEAAQDRLLRQIHRMDQDGNDAIQVRTYEFLTDVPEVVEMCEGWRETYGDQDIAGFVKVMV